MLSIYFVYKLREPFFIISLALLIGSVFLLDNLLVEAPVERIHFLKFGGLAILCFVAGPPWRLSRRAVLSFAIAATIGCLEEGIQAFVPNRYYTPKDLFLNAVSAALGSCAALATTYTLSLKKRALKTGNV